MTKKPIYICRKYRPSPFELTLDEWLRREPPDLLPICKSFKDGKKLVRRYRQCEKEVKELLAKDPMRTYQLWHELKDFQDTRTYVLNDMLTEGKITIIGQGLYASGKEYWYYLIERLPVTMTVLIVPYKRREKKKSSVQL